MIPMKNKYIYRSRISEKNLEKYWTIFFVSLCSHHFKRSLDTEATKISILSSVSRIALNKLFKQIRTIIAKECENSSRLQGEIDESYFGAKRIRGKRGRGSGGKIPVFGILKRDGNVYTQVVTNCKAKTLIPILREFSDSRKHNLFRFLESL